jgi:hypothetical protein
VLKGRSLIKTLKFLMLACISLGLGILSSPNIAQAILDPALTITPQDKPKDGLKIEATLFNDKVVETSTTTKADTLQQDLEVEKEEIRALATTYLRDKKKAIPNLSETQKKMFEEGFNRCTKSIEESLSEVLSSKQANLDKRNLLKKDLIIEKAKASIYFYKWLVMNKSHFTPTEWEKIDADLLSPLRVEFFEISGKDLELKQFNKTFSALNGISPAKEVNKKTVYEGLLEKLSKNGSTLSAMSKDQMSRFLLSEEDKKFLSENSLQKGSEMNLLYKTLVADLKKLEIEKEIINKESLLKKTKSMIEEKQKELKSSIEDLKKTQDEIDELNRKLKEEGLSDEDKEKHTKELGVKEEDKQKLKLKEKSLPNEIKELEKEYKETSEKKDDRNQQYNDKLKSLNDLILQKQNDINRHDKDLSIISNDKKDLDLSNKTDKEAYIKGLLASNPFCMLLKVDYASLETLCSTGLFEILDDSNHTNISSLLTALNKNYDPQSTVDRVIPTRSKALEVAPTPASAAPVPDAAKTTPAKSLTKEEEEAKAKKEEEDKKKKDAEAAKEAVAKTDLFTLVCHSGCSQVSCDVSSSEDDDDKDEDEDEKKPRRKDKDDDKKEDIVLELKFTDKDKESLYRYSLDWKCDDEACSFADSVLKKSFTQVEEDLDVFVVNNKDGEELRSNSCTIKKSKEELEEKFKDPFLNNNQNGNGMMQQQMPNTPPQNFNSYPFPTNMAISVVVDVGFA